MRSVWPFTKSVAFVAVIAIGVIGCGRSETKGTGGAGGKDGSSGHAGTGGSGGAGQGGFSDAGGSDAGGNGNADAAVVLDTGTTPPANTQKNAQLCSSLDADACAQIDGCEPLSASPIDLVLKCLRKPDLVGCWLPSYGCAVAVTIAIDERGQCWRFSCLNVPKRMTDLFGRDDTIVKQCGDSYSSLIGLAGCEDSGS